MVVGSGSAGSDDWAWCFRKDWGVELAIICSVPAVAFDLLVSIELRCDFPDPPPPDPSLEGFSGALTPLEALLFACCW